MLLLEVQQSSDITYRIYDYDRLDPKTGRKRKLHKELAVSSINFSKNKNEKIKYDSIRNELNPVIENDFFKIYYLKTNGKETKKIFMNKSFWVFVCLEGLFSIHWENKEQPFKKGGTFLIPSVLNFVNIRGRGEIIAITT